KHHPLPPAAGSAGVGARGDRRCGAFQLRPQGTSPRSTPGGSRHRPRLRGLDVRGRPIPRLVLAVAVPGTRNTRWVVAVEISLRRLAESFERFRPGETGAAFLLDGENKIILHPDRQLMLKQASMRDHPLVKGGQNSEWLGANEPVPLLGW